MRSVRILACALVSLFLAVNAPIAAAEQWVTLDENESSSFSYDKDGTSKPKEGIIRVTTRVIYTEQGKAEARKMLTTEKDIGKLYASRYLHDLDCTEMESHLLQATHLDKGGVVLKSTDLSSVTDWEGIPPDVRMALVAERVCSQ